jgi:hypothetical protein
MLRMALPECQANEVASAYAGRVIQREQAHPYPE